jgi:8-oxo-dGTP diphosphatase
VLYVVRHAKAGSRHDFNGDDRLRPLSSSGKLQAEALATRLKPLLSEGSKTLVSSPFLRCIQTLRPLAKQIESNVEIDESLAENHSFIDVLDLLMSLPEDSAICSHGDIIPELIGALERRGCEFLSTPDFRKASVWVLERNNDEIVRAESWPPPSIDR